MSGAIPLFPLYAFIARKEPLIFSSIHNYQWGVNPLYGSHNYKIICFKVSPVMTDIYIGYIRNFNGYLSENIPRLHYKA